MSWVRACTLLFKENTAADIRVLVRNEWGTGSLRVSGSEMSGVKKRGREGEDLHVMPQWEKLSAAQRPGGEEGLRTPINLVNFRR